MLTKLKFKLIMFLAKLKYKIISEALYVFCNNYLLHLEPFPKKGIFKQAYNYYLDIVKRTDKYIFKKENDKNV